MKKKNLIPAVFAIALMVTFTISNKSNDSTSSFFVESDNIALAETAQGCNINIQNGCSWGGSWSWSKKMQYS